MKLSQKKALWASYTLLDVVYNSNREKYIDNFAEFLSEMNPFTFTDRICADQALWDSWVACCKKISPNEFISQNETFEVLSIFLHENHNQYQGWADFDLEEIVLEIKKLKNNGQWDEIVSKVYSYQDDIK